jgi:WD40 repeat protein
MAFARPAEGFQAAFPGQPTTTARNDGDLKIQVHQLDLPSERSAFAVEVIDTSQADLAQTESARRQQVALANDPSGEDYQKVMLGLLDDLVKKEYPQAENWDKQSADALQGHPVFAYELTLPDKRQVKGRGAVVRRKIYFWTVTSSRMPALRPHAEMFLGSLRLVDPPEPWVVAATPGGPAGSGGSVSRTTLPVGKMVVAMAYQRDAKRLVSRTMHGEVKLWDLATRRAADPPGPSVPELTREVFGLSADGRKMAVVAKDKMITVVSLDGAGAPLRLEPAPAEIVGDQVQLGGRLVFSPDGNFLCIDLARSAGNWHSVKIWDLRAVKLSGQLDGGKQTYFAHLAFAEDGSKLATVRDGKVQLWDTTGTRLSELKAKAKLVGPLVWAATGKVLAVYGEDSKVYLFNPEDGKELPSARPGSTMGMALHPSGSWLAALDGDQAISIWNVARGKKLKELTIPGGSIHGLLFLPDHNRLAVAARGEIQVYDLRGLKLEK